jgi:hypothetical protein
MSMRMSATGSDTISARWRSRSRITSKSRLIGRPPVARIVRLSDRTSARRSSKYTSATDRGSFSWTKASIPWPSRESRLGVGAS